MSKKQNSPATLQDGRTARSRIAEARRRLPTGHKALSWKSNGTLGADNDLAMRLESALATHEGK